MTVLSGIIFITLAVIWLANMFIVWTLANQVVYLTREVKRLQQKIMSSHITLKNLPKDIANELENSPIWEK